MLPKQSALDDPVENTRVFLPEFFGEALILLIFGNLNFKGDKPDPPPYSTTAIGFRAASYQDSEE